MIWLLFLTQVAFGFEGKVLKNTTGKLYLEVPSKNVRILCPELPKEDRDDPDAGYVLTVRVQFKGQNYKLDWRRGYPLDNCAGNRDRLKKVLNQNRVVRVFGFSYNHFSEKLALDKAEDGYDFDRIDNGKGQCEGYFEHSCSVDNIEKSYPM